MRDQGNELVAGAQSLLQTLSRVYFVGYLDTVRDHSSDTPLLVPHGLEDVVEIPDRIAPPAVRKGNFVAGQDFAGFIHASKKMQITELRAWVSNVRIASCWPSVPLALPKPRK